MNTSKQRPPKDDNGHSTDDDGGVRRPLIALAVVVAVAAGFNLALTLIERQRTPAHANDAATVSAASGYQRSPGQPPSPAHFR